MLCDSKTARFLCLEINSMSSLSLFVLQRYFRDSKSLHAMKIELGIFLKNTISSQNSLVDGRH
jgi:hypothetical protein